MPRHINTQEETITPRLQSPGFKAQQRSKTKVKTKYNTIQSKEGKTTVFHDAFPLYGPARKWSDGGGMVVCIKGIKGEMKKTSHTWSYIRPAVGDAHKTPETMQSRALSSPGDKPDIQKRMKTGTMRSVCPEPIVCFLNALFFLLFLSCLPLPDGETNGWIGDFSLVVELKNGVF